MCKKNTLLYCLVLLFSSSLFSQTEPDYSEYGGKVSIGVSIFDGFGIPVRVYKGNHVFEGGAYVAGIAFTDPDGFLEDILTVPMFGAGYTYFGDRFLKVKKKRDKIRANGIAVRVNQIVGDYSTTIPSLSWAQETFREGRTKRSFLFELGIQYGFPHFEYLNAPINNSVGIRLRCQWNFFLK